MFCREQVVQLHRERDAIQKAGAELVVIGNGAPHFIAGFREITGYDGPLYTDPSLVSYKLAGMKRGLMTTLKPQVLGHAVRALAKGHMQGRTQGDAFQQGGVVVVSPADGVRYAYQSDEAGDHPPVREILDALGPAHAA